MVENRSERDESPNKWNAAARGFVKDFAVSAVITGIIRTANSIFYKHSTTVHTVGDWWKQGRWKLDVVIAAMFGVFGAFEDYHRAEKDAKRNKERESKPVTLTNETHHCSDDNQPYLGDNKFVAGVQSAVTSTAIWTGAFMLISLAWGKLFKLESARTIGDWARSGQWKFDAGLAGILSLFDGFSAYKKAEAAEQQFKDNRRENAELKHVLGQVKELTKDHPVARVEAASAQNEALLAAHSLNQAR